MLRQQLSCINMFRRVALKTLHDDQLYEAERLLLSTTLGWLRCIEFE
jgi:hypothetical protein